MHSEAYDPMGRDSQWDGRSTSRPTPKNTRMPPLPRSTFRMIRPLLSNVRAAPNTSAYMTEDANPRVAKTTPRTKASDPELDALRNCGMTLA